jgi:hypothetical protein
MIYGRVDLLEYVFLINIVTCTPIVRQRVGKRVPVKTDAW